MNFYNFEISDKKPVEEVYSTDCELLSYFFLFSRKDYPGNVYFKISTDFKEILEYYPTKLTASAEKDIEIFKGNLPPPPKKKYSYSTPSFYSWDGKTTPTQVYKTFTVNSECVRYTENKLDRVYTIVYRHEFNKMFQDIKWPEKTEAFIRNKSPDYILLYTDNETKELQKFALGYYVLPKHMEEVITKLIEEEKNND